MKAFISYSMAKSDQYMITLLISELSKIGVGTITSIEYNQIRNLIEMAIQKSDIFIGIISDSRIDSKSVLDEWNIAKKLNKPCVMLFEKNVKYSSRQQDNIFTFNKLRPYETVESIISLITKEKEKQDNATAAAIILGGTAILALMTMLANDKKKRDSKKKKK